MDTDVQGGQSHGAEGWLESGFRAGNDVEALVNGDQIFPAMLEAMEKARHSICLETYIYWNGEIAQKFADALSKASRRDVEVRVVLDEYGCSQLDDRLLVQMRDAGVGIHMYRPVRWLQLRRSNHRSHRKLMIVDRSIGFIGGVGIADEWSGDARNRSEWRDNHFRVTGPVVHDMERVFDEHWPGDALAVSSDCPAGMDPQGSLVAGILASEPLQNHYEVAMVFATALDRAESSVHICSPYFLPDDRLKKALLAARERGVRVLVVTAGKHTDKQVVRWASRHNWEDLLEAGVEIFEFAPTLIHVKSMVVDSILTIVGSANFDVRAARLNDEACLVVKDRGFAEEEEDRISADMKRCSRVTLDGWRSRTLSQRLLDRSANLLKAHL